MKPQNETPAPIPEPRPPGSPFSIRHLLPGLAIGMLLGIVGLLTFQNHLPGLTKALYTITLISFGVVVLSFLIVFVFRQVITRKLLGENSAGDFLNDAQTLADSVTDQLAKNALVNVAPETSERVRKVLPRLANWFIWARLRNWWWNWILGVFISLGGLTGTLLLMNQNELLEAQNKKIDDQTGLLQAQNDLVSRQMQLEEANRRSALVVLMSNIMDKVDREIESQQKGLSIKAKEQKKYTLSQSLIGQIAALSHSFKPYRYMDGDTLIGRPLSPERGQLLITLTLLPLDTSTFRKIYQSATFESAGLKDAILTKANLHGADLSRADLSRADLREADLREADLREADLSRADLSRADLSRAGLSGADLSGADLRANLHGADLSMAFLIGADLESAYLISADLSEANLSEADLSEANLSEADLREADLSMAFLIRADLESAYLISADLSGANLSGADLREADLREADLSRAHLSATKNITVHQLLDVFSLYAVKNLNDSLSIPLKQQYPNLFKYINRDSINGIK